jgi:hypothetical protein
MTDAVVCRSFAICGMEGKKMDEVTAVCDRDVSTWVEFLMMISRVGAYGIGKRSTKR